MTAAEERHEKQMREVQERRRTAVVEAVDQLVYDLGRSSTEAWALVDRLRAECARLTLEKRALEQQLKQRPSTTAKEEP